MQAQELWLLQKFKSEEWWDMGICVQSIDKSEK